MSSKKQFDKAKKREKRIRQKKLFLEAESLKSEKRDKYPRFVIGRSDADLRFIQIIVEAAERLDFLDTTLIGQGQQAFLQMGKELGFNTAIAYLNSLPSLNFSGKQFTGDAKLALAITNLGSILFNSIPPEIRYLYMPFNDCAVEFVGRDIRLNFSSIDAEHFEVGRAYFSKREPQIVFDDQPYTVAFSKHAIERICKRLNSNYIDYGPAGDIHAFFSTCVYFEPTLLYGNQPAFALFDMCNSPGFSHYTTYVQGVYGEHNVLPKGGRLYYRVGYCPVVFEGRFAKAKTFIQPGYRSTPEYGLLLNDRIACEKRDEFLEKVTDDNRSESDTLYWNDSEATKWFHENGVPQVFQWKRDVFLPLPS